MKKWVLGLLVALFMVSAAFAGEDPYIAIVGNDKLVANDFYFSPKHLQFLFDQEGPLFSIPVCITAANATNPNEFIIPGPYRNYAAGCEQFRSQAAVKEAEICDVDLFLNPNGTATFRGLPNAKVTAGNSGWFEWYIRLPKKPSGEINLCFQCGVLKPDAFQFVSGFGSPIELCAAETGERVGSLCSRIEVDPGTNPIIPRALPTIFAEALPGDFANPDFPKTGFKLTAWRNPSLYQGGGNAAGDGFGPDMANGVDLQVLNNSQATRILLKSCFDKCIVAKLPVTGAINADGQQEFDLEAGDIIHVRMNVPRYNTVDIFCEPQSLKIMGIGEVP